MSKSNNVQNVGEGEVISSRRGLRKRGVIIVSIVAFLLVGGVVGASVYYGKDFPPYGFISGLINKETQDDSTADSDKDPAKPVVKGELSSVNQEAIDKQREEVAALVSAGDASSVKKAEQAVDAGIVSAEKSGDEAYLVEAKLEKALLLIETGRPQEALDTILLPLDQQYGNNETYKYQIYTYIAQAYTALDNQAKSDEYSLKIPAIAENE